MKKPLRGFTFVEVILYIGLFALLGTALFTFAWDMLRLSHEGNTERLVTEEARFALERMKYSIRGATGIDGDNSIFESADGKLVLDLPGTSDTVTFERESGQLTMQVSGQDKVALHSQDLRVTTLRFERFTGSDQSPEYIDIQATFETAVTAPSEYVSTLTVETGASLRNLGL